MLSTKQPLSIQKRINDEISALQQSFLSKENNNGPLEKYWVTVEDDNSFMLLIQKLRDKLLQMSLVN